MNLTDLAQSKLLKAWGAPQDTEFTWVMRDYTGETVSRPLYRHELSLVRWPYEVQAAAYDLEELIAWLEDEFFELKLIPGGKWEASYWKQDAVGFVSGDTPLAAVFALAEAIHGGKQ